MAALLVSAAALPVLAGCGGGSGGGAARQVASIPSSAGSGRSGGQPTATAGTQKTGLEGPTLPDNASLGELKRIFNPWMTCLAAHGDTAIETKSDGVMAPSGSIPPAAGKACRPLQPHPPWQEIPADNPQYNQDYAKWINCMNARGVRVTAVPGGFNYDDEAQADTPRTSQIQTSCEMQAFGEH